MVWILELSHGRGPILFRGLECLSTFPRLAPVHVGQIGGIEDHRGVAPLPPVPYIAVLGEDIAGFVGFGGRVAAAVLGDFPAGHKDDGGTVTGVGPTAPTSMGIGV